jgi:hypothetical protein
MAEYGEWHRKGATLSTAPHNRVSEILLSARHSREGGNPDVAGKPLDPRLRGGDGTTNWALY